MAKKKKKDKYTGLRLMYEKDTPMMDTFKWVTEKEVPAMKKKGYVFVKGEGQAFKD